MSGPWDPAGKVDVMDVLEKLDMENVRPEGFREARFSCPYPGHENGDMSASAYMNKETCVWWCHGCKRKGSVISFTASILGISPIKAKQLLRQAYDPASLNPDERNMVEELHEFFRKRRERAQDVPRNIPIADLFLDPFAVDWQAVEDAGDDAPEALRYMLERGFEPETLENWGFGFDERTNRITFAVRNEHGKLVGFKGRAWDGRHPKYLVVGDSPQKEPHYGFGRYYTGSVIFGLHAAIDSFMDQEFHHEPAEVLVYEGELNAIALHQMGYSNAVALNGSNLTGLQARLIRRHVDRAIFCFDPDAAGERGIWGWDDEETGEHHLGALEKLATDIDVMVAWMGEKDAADCLRDGEEKSVADAVSSAESYTVAKLRRKLLSSRAPQHTQLTLNK